MRQPGLRVQDQPHGSASTYTNWGCRCPECVAANTARVRESRARRQGELLANSARASHGSLSTYQNWFCRCLLCIEAGRTRHRNRGSR